MSLYRILSGIHKGEEVLPIHISKNSQRISHLIDNEEVWFNRDQVFRLACTVLNCRNYTWDMAYDYCKKCQQLGRDDGSKIPLSLTQGVGETAELNR